MGHAYPRHNILSRVLEGRVLTSICFPLTLRLTTPSQKREDMGSVQVGFYGHVRQYHNLKDEIAAVVHEVLESGSYVMGPRLKQFEKELAECCRAKETVGVNSGTDALWLAFMALGIGPGDEVITTSNSFFGTAEAIWIAGATAVFVDCDPKTCNIDTSLINDHARHHQRATLHPRSHSAAAGGAGARSSRGKYSPPHRGVSQDHNGNARALEVLLRYPKRRAGFRPVPAPAP